MSLKIHVYTVCWNEAAMLPHFLTYYSEFCEKIIVYDNYSTDDSVKICEQFPKVQIKNFFTDSEIRDDIYLKIKNEAWKNSRGQCDYVIVCDVDEFVYHPQLSDFLKQKAAEGITLFRTSGFNMVASDFPAPGINLIQTIREGVPSLSFSKLSVFNPDLVEEINYEYGGHKCCPVGRLKFSIDEVKLLHYKFLGLDRTLKRYREMGSRLSKYNRKRGLGLHYLYSSGRIKKEFNQLFKSKEQVI